MGPIYSPPLIESHKSCGGGGKEVFSPNDYTIVFIDRIVLIIDRIVSELLEGNQSETWRASTAHYVTKTYKGQS